MTHAELIATKSSDTICVMGSGSSIGKITDAEWSFIASKDSIAFNWFCFGPTPLVPTYYIWSIQGCKIKDEGTVSEKEVFLERVKCKIAIVLETIEKRKTPFRWVDHLDMVRFPYIIARPFGPDEDPCNLSAHIKGNPFLDGLYNPRTAIGYALHIAVWMGYKKIVFFGVDLNDTRYFWLSHNETWAPSSRDGQKNSDVHVHAQETIDMARNLMQEFPDIELSAHNPGSLLIPTIPAWRMP